MSAPAFENLGRVVATVSAWAAVGYCAEVIGWPAVFVAICAGAATERIWGR